MPVYVYTGTELSVQSFSSIKLFLYLQFYYSSIGWAGLAGKCFKRLTIDK